MVAPADVGARSTDPDDDGTHITQVFDDGPLVTDRTPTTDRTPPPTDAPTTEIPAIGGMPATTTPTARSPQITALGPEVEMAGLVPITPNRVLDTRIGIGRPGTSPVGADQQFTLSLAAVASLPANVDTVAINVTATASTAPGYVTVWPDGTRPGTSNLNNAPGFDVPNLVITRVAPDRTVRIYNAHGTTHLVADLVGYSTDVTDYHALAPERLLDTRDGTGAPAAPIGPNGTLTVQITGRGGVPTSGVGAVVINITATNPTENGHVTVWPTGDERPLASTLNVRPSTTFANLAIAAVGTGGRIDLYNYAGSTDLIADVVGWLPVGGAYRAITPTRVLDTRPTSAVGRSLTLTGGLFTNGSGTPVTAGTMRAVDLSDVLGDMTGITAVALNVTLIATTRDTHLSLWAYGSPPPPTSSVNARAGAVVPNLAIVEAGAQGWINLSNAFGAADVVLDVVGYFVTRPTGMTLDAPGSLVQAIHVLPAGVSASFDDDDVRSVLAASQDFLSTQRGRTVAFDTVDGQIEVTTVQLNATSATLLAAYGTGSATGLNNMFTLIDDELLAQGYGVRDRVAAAFVEGLNISVCGLAIIGDGNSGAAQIYTDACNAMTTGARPAVGATWDTSRAARVFLHEFLHTQGALNTCAPHHVSGHSNELGDVMSPTDYVVGATRMPGRSDHIDTGDDDYWGIGAARSCAAGGAWPDVSRSPFLRAG